MMYTITQKLTITQNFKWMFPTFMCQTVEVLCFFLSAHKFLSLSWWTLRFNTSTYCTGSLKEALKNRTVLLITVKRSSLNQWKSSLQWPTYTVLSRVTVPDNPCILVEESTTQSYSSTSSVFSSYSDTLELWDFIRLSNRNGITRKSTAEMP